MARKNISWILKFASNLKTTEEKIECLRQNDVPAIRQVLQYTFHPNIKWLLPDTDPPYTPCQFDSSDSNFYKEVRKLYLFVEGGNPNLNQVQRERMFINMLESIHPEDALLLLSMKNKQLPYPGLTKSIINKAFPGIFS